MFHKFYIESLSKISTKHFKVACFASVSSVLKQYDYIEESKKEMDKAIELANHSENDEYSFSKISENLIEQEQIELGIKIAKENLSIDEQHEIFFLAVKLYASQKKFDKAIELIISMELLSYVKKSLIICGKSISVNDLFQFKINEIDKKISSVIEGYILGNAYTFVTKNQKCLAFLLLGNDAKNIMEYLYHFASQLIFIDKDFNSEVLSILSEVINIEEFIEISVS
jgi:hypothetical protein